MQLFPVAYSWLFSSRQQKDSHLSFNVVDLRKFKQRKQRSKVAKLIFFFFAPLRCITLRLCVKVYDRLSKQY